METPITDKKLKQTTNYTCGPAALRYVFAKSDLKLSEETIAKESGANPKNGIDPKDMARYAKRNGFHAETITHPDPEKYLSMLDFLVKTGMSVIVDYLAGNTEDDGHYVVFLGLSKGKIKIWNPSGGNEQLLDKEYFVKHWRDKTKNDQPFKNLAILIHK